MADGVRDPVFPPGTAVKVVRPDFPTAFRRGQVGTVRKVFEHEFRRGNTAVHAALHTVDFPTDEWAVPLSPQGVPLGNAEKVNYGKVPGWFMGRELAAVAKQGVDDGDRVGQRGGWPLGRETV